MRLRPRPAGAAGGAEPAADRCLVEAPGPPVTRLRRMLGCVLAVPLLVLINGSATVGGAHQLEAAPASVIRAGMLVNFARFVEWPADHGPDNALLLCVVDDAAVADALEDLVRGRSLERRALTVRRLKFDGALRECHLLYASGLDRQRAGLLLERVKDASVFTVSDFEGFAPMGGVVHFFVQGSRMRFAINPAAALRARLKISSQVLSVGSIVKDENAN